MATTPQSAKPSVFMPYVKTQIATILALDSGFIRIVSEPTDKWPTWATEPVSVSLYLSPLRARENSGAGRYAYFIDRTIFVTVWVRCGTDIAGDETIGLGRIWDYEDTLIDSLLLKLPAALTPAGIQFHRPFKLSEDDGVKRLMKVDAGKYRLTLGLDVTYSAPVTV